MLSRWTICLFSDDDLYAGWTGLFCPCVLFGRNVERLKDDVQWTTPCVCHAIFVEGGIALGATTVALHGLSPSSVFLVAEGLLFAWWMCGIYTGLFRQELQRKYHLQVNPPSTCDCPLCKCCRLRNGKFSIYSSVDGCGIITMLADTCK